MAERRFTVDQANRALALIRPVVEEARAHYLDLRTDLASLDQYASLEEISSDTSIPPHVRAKLASIEACLAELRTLAVTVVDPEIGIVSIDGSLPDGSDVHLCWKLGEDRVRSWYPLGGRYSERRPVPLAASV